MSEYLTFIGSAVDSNRLLYTPSPFARENLLHLQETGTLRALKQHKSERDGLDSYLFFVVMSGNGTLKYENTDYALSAGDCVFIDCSKPYSHSTSLNLWSLAWVHFSSVTMPGIYSKYVERGGSPVFRPQAYAPYLSLMQEVREIAESSDFLKDMRINAKLSELLTHIMEMSWSPEKQQKRPGDADTVTTRSIKEIRAYLDQHYTEKITLEDLSEKFFINRFYLTKLFKSMYGDTIINYVNKLRITNAKKLLRFSDKSIEEAGALSGFEDANYFSRIFKKVEGTTPGEYRRTW